MVKKVLSILVTILILVLIGIKVTGYYIEHYYKDPGAINAREQKNATEKYDDLLNRLSNVDRQDELIVCINPSYGGKEDGPSQGNIVAKNVTLQVAQNIENLTKGKEEYKVYSLRMDDIYLSDDQRNELIDILNPDLIIDLKVTESDDAQEFGISAKYSDEYFDYRLNNAEMASILVEELSKATESKALGVFQMEEEECIADGRKVPYALVYLGYISSELEGDAFGSQAYLKNMSQGIVNALDMSCEKLNEEVTE